MAKMKHWAELIRARVPDGKTVGESLTGEEIVALAYKAGLCPEDFEQPKV